MATYRIYLENLTLEYGSTEVEADSPEAAAAKMERQIEEGNYDTSWNYADTLLCRVLEIEDEDGNVFAPVDDGAPAKTDDVATAVHA